LARLHIPGLNRSYISALIREGFDNEECLKELSAEELAKVLPQRLAKRIKKRINFENSELVTENCKVQSDNYKPETCNSQPLLQIDQHRPDRIIFLGKEVKLTPTGFSLLYLLAQHREKVVSYEEILKDLWRGEEDAIYTRINYHICKIRKDISKIMDKKEDNTKKIENIFKAIPGRGLMLNIKEEELKLV